MKLLTNEQQELYEKGKSAIFVEKNMKINMLMVKRFVKLEIIVVMQVNIEVLRICNLKCSTPKWITEFFHNESNYDYNFTIKELVEELNLKDSLLV